MKNALPKMKLILNGAFHLFFWVGVYFFYTYYLGYGSSNTTYVNLFSAFLMPITVAMSYFFLYYLIPKYLLEKKQGLFILYAVYTFIVSAFFIVLSVLYGLVFLIDLKPENTAPLTKSLLFIILGVYFVVLIVIMLGLVLHNYKSTIKNEDLKSKFLQAQLQLKEQELKFLRMQIHPHFLFNSLNTIYGFALKKGDEAPEMILKLSNLLDYILYQVEKPSVLLQDEINHLEDYISLEKMRFHDTLNVSFSNAIEDANVQIAPMLLIPFVENSFKHGVIIDGKLQVSIRLAKIKNELIFEVVNSSKETKENKNGIGLENSKRRLQMLYPNNYNLDISRTESEYKVLLKVAIDKLKLIKNEN